MTALNVPVFRPDLGEQEIEEVVAALRSAWLTTGPRVRRFEEEFATAVGEDLLTAALVSGPSHGILIFNPNGSFSYTPAADFNGTDSFTSKANDGALDSNVATVSITVAAVNDVPAAQSQSVSTAEDTAKSLGSPPREGLVVRSDPVAGLAGPSAGPPDLLTVPGGNAATPSPAGDAAARALLLPLVNQFANVQRQMFDQFQQALTMVLQTLGAWHSDQVRLIGHELRQLREITGDLQSLRLQLAQQRPEDRDAAPSPGVRSIAGPSRTGREGAPSTPGICLAPVPQAADSGLQPVGEAATAGPPPEDAHAWLYQRVANLEGERQSTWQRILGFLFKGEAGVRAP